MYTNLQKYAADLPAAEHALGAIALLQHRGDDAAWYLRKAAREAPRVLETRRAVIAAELARKDAAAALEQLEPALGAWPDDAVLHYLAGARARSSQATRAAARAELRAALDAWPGLRAARAALGRARCRRRGRARLGKPELVRPWGDREALAAELARCTRGSAKRWRMRAARTRSRSSRCSARSARVRGAAAKDAARITSCPVDAVAPAWAAAQAARAQYERLGSELEASYQRIVRHDELGLTAGLLPNARLAVAAAKQSFRLALADAGELRAELGARPPAGAARGRLQRSRCSRPRSRIRRAIT